VEQAMRWHEASGGMLFSYLAFGPLFPTATKHDADPVTGTAILREVRAMWPGPLVGIGGIAIENLPTLAEAGLTRPALISALMAPTSDEIVTATARMQSAWLQATESRATLN
jgi:thiamine-phosphate diphosphorylase